MNCTNPVRVSPKKWEEPAFHIEFIKDLDGFPIRGDTSVLDNKILAPCGQCLACKERRRADWSFRIAQELKDSRSAYFITLTYEDEHIPYADDDGVHVPGGTISKKEVQLFLKRLRAYQSKLIQSLTKYPIVQEKALKWKIRYYFTGEYGDITHRPHYHAIIFNILPGTLVKLSDIWGKGHVHHGSVKTASIHYVAGYMIKKCPHPGGTAPFNLMSRKPAIGHGYIKRAGKFHIENNALYVESNGHKRRMPRYYKNNIDFEASVIERYNNKLRKEKRNKFMDELAELESRGLPPPIISEKIAKDDEQSIRVYENKINNKQKRKL